MPRGLKAACAALGSVCLFVLAGCGLSLNGVSASTEVKALPTEDLVPSCKFDLRMFLPNQPQRAVLVVYERGDSDQLFDDPDIEELAKQNDLAMVYAHQCNAPSLNDIQPDGGKGPGRELFVALNQLAQTAKHPELANANVILYGFSAGGILAATTTNNFPNRVLGFIAYAAGSPYVDISRVIIPDAATHIPSLIIANAKDEASGTYRSHLYFQAGRNAGAIWAYAVQQGRGHCCSDSTKGLIMPWINAIVALRSAPVSAAIGPQVHGPLQVNASAGVIGRFVCSPDSTTDPFGNTDCSFTNVSIGNGATTAETAWLPNQTSATEWRTWVTAHH